MKKVDAYCIFFKKNISILKQVYTELRDSSPSNLAQLKSILESIIALVEDPLQSSSTTSTLIDEDIFERPLTSKTSAFSFIKPTQDVLPTTQINTNVPKRANAFSFIHQSKSPSQNKETNNPQIEKLKKESENKNEVYKKEVTVERHFAEIPVNSTQINPTTTTISNKRNYFEELNSIDFTAPSNLSSNQQASPGSRLDALWSLQNHMDGTLDCMTELNREAEKKRKQQQEIEDKFFGFVSVSASLL